MSPSQASETCASASSATSAYGNSLCERGWTLSRKHSLWMGTRDVSTWRFRFSTRNRCVKTKLGAVPTGSPIPGARGRYSSQFCICLPLPVFRQPQLVAAIAPIIPIHSSVANNESIIVDIPMTTSANAAAPEDIPYTRSARPTAIPAAISGVVAVYKFAAFIIRVAENPTAAMTSSPALAQSCCWKNHRQQYGKNNH